MCIEKRGGVRPQNGGVCTQKGGVWGGGEYGGENVTKMAPNPKKKGALKEGFCSKKKELPIKIALLCI